MGMFKDMRNLTKQAKDLQKDTNTPGMREMLKQAPGQIKDATNQLQDMQERQSPEVLAAGEPGTGIVKGMGTPERGAAWFNLDIDLEVRVKFREPYRVTNMYLVPSWAQLGPGTEIPIKVDREDPAKIGIDWDRMEQPAERGEIRPA